MSDEIATVAPSLRTMSAAGTSFAAKLWNGTIVKIITSAKSIENTLLTFFVVANGIPP